MTSTRTQSPGARVLPGVMAASTEGVPAGRHVWRSLEPFGRLLDRHRCGISRAGVGWCATRHRHSRRADQDWARAPLVPVQAQADHKPRINIGKVVLVEPASETPMPIQIGPIDAIPRNSFVRIRGLPSAAVLSDGHSIAPGAWAIPLAVLPNLRISLPVGIVGKSEVSIALVQIDGTVLAEAKSIADHRGRRDDCAGAAGSPRASAASPRSGPRLRRWRRHPRRHTRPPAPAATPQSSEPPPLTEEQKRALTFIDRGRTQAERGNISAARLFYRRAADAGLAEGALALAATYDPGRAGPHAVAGVQPDLALAREWYEKARQLGAKRSRRATEAAWF